MRVLHLTHSDRQGGAARAAWRIHEALLDNEVESRMLVATSIAPDKNVSVLKTTGGPLAEKVIRKVRRKWLARREHAFAVANAGGKYNQLHGVRTAWKLPVDHLKTVDVVHLHVVSETVDLLQLANWLPKDKAVVWTLHDMNAFTGGCHYTQGCVRYEHQCGKCPQLESSNNLDCSRKSWLDRKNAMSILGSKRTAIVAPSRWLESESKQAPILNALPVFRIPNPINLSVFHPISSDVARSALSLPPDKPVILLLADQLDAKRKGVSMIFDALRKLESKNYSLLSVGRGLIPDFGVKHQRLEVIQSDQLLALAYSCATVFVTTPLQDNLPNVIGESLACGVPVISTNVGGIPDIVIEGKTGFLVDSGNIDGLLGILNELTKCQPNFLPSREDCRTFAEEYFNPSTVADKYIRVYRDLLS